MKPLIKVITQPLLIVLLFSGIIISGEQMGGFYLLYILLGLPHLVLHSIFGIAGIVCLLFAYYSRKIKVSFLYLLGAGFMIASLSLFFLQSKGYYNYNTFHETLPVSLLIVFAIVIIIFIVTNIYAFANDAKD